MDWMHALATGLLIAVTYFLVEKAGLLEGKSLGRKLLIMIPIYFVVIFILNILWPGDWAN